MYSDNPLSSKRALLLLDPPLQALAQAALEYKWPPEFQCSAMNACEAARALCRSQPFRCETSPLGGTRQRVSVADLFDTLIPVDDPDDNWPPATSLLNWGRFDLVVIGANCLLDPNGYELSCLGAKLAMDDSYERANSRTRKIVVEVDEPDYGLRRKIDPKNLMNWVSLSERDGIIQLRKLAVHSKAQTSPSGSRIIHLTYPSTVPRFQEYIRKSTNLIFVEDEEEDLQSTYHDITGNSAGRCSDTSSLKMCVRRQSADESTHPRRNNFATSEELLNGINGALNQITHDAEGQELTIMITDLLFKQSPHFGGLDLIDEVRKMARELKLTLGVVAYTGFGASSLVMSALRRGADLVVRKPDKNEVSHSGHHDLPQTARERLVSAVAEICLQKDYFNRASAALKRPRANRAVISQDLHRVFDAYSVVSSIAPLVRQLQYEIYKASDSQ